jgi:hypothetical protein
MVGQHHSDTHTHTVARNAHTWARVERTLTVAEQVGLGRRERGVLCTRATEDNGPRSYAAVRGYSARLNSQIAMNSITNPRTAITPASTRLGTCQPNQVTPGASAWRAAAGMSRWAKIARRIGSTA